MANLKVSIEHEGLDISDADLIELKTQVLTLVYKTLAVRAQENNVTSPLNIQEIGVNGPGNGPIGFVVALQ